jgi:hypothetical protein
MCCVDRIDDINGSSDFSACLIECADYWITDTIRREEKK